MASGVYPLINVENLDKSIEWYKAVGVKARRHTEGGMSWGEVASGDGMVIMYPKNQAPTIPQNADTASWLAGELGRGVMLIVGIGDAKKTWNKVRSAGFVVDQPLQAEPWGGHSFSLLDPDGYVVNFTDRFPDDAAAKKTKVVAKAKKTVRRATKGRAKRR